MGYQITIGEARCAVVVHGVLGAPDDGHGEHSNTRWPSYRSWGQFTDNCELAWLFWNPRDGLMREHPGCAPITAAHHTVVKRALAEQRMSQTISACDMERLTWLEFWMAWALVNCKHPALHNC